MPTRILPRAVSAGLPLLAAFGLVHPAPGQDTAPSPPPQESELEAWATQAGERHHLSGPSSTDAQLQEDRRPKEPVFRFDTAERALAPWFEFKDRLREDHGLTLGLDYTALGQGATQSPGEHFAAGGIFRLFGTWTLTGRGGKNTGSVVFKGESRHRLGTSISPQMLGFESGSVSVPATTFSDYGWGVTNLYWQQRVLEGRLSFQGGWVDCTDYLDLYGLINPWTSFLNLAFLTGSATIPAPNQGMGAAFAAYLSDNVYLVGGVADTNGDPAHPVESAESFFEDYELFTHVELGWMSTYERRYLDNAHVTLWHADERKDAGVPSGWGLAFSVTRAIGDRWLPFLRGGYAEDGGALLDRSLSLGFGRFMAQRSDLLGLGLNWGRPSSSFGEDLDDQYTAELFYRVQMSKSFAITPDLQAVLNPALNPDESTSFILGLRARLSL